MRPLILALEPHQKETYLLKLARVMAGEDGESNRLNCAFASADQQAEAYINVKQLTR
jgi:hypothetical protein